MPCIFDIDIFAVSIRRCMYEYSKGCCVAVALHFLPERPSRPSTLVPNRSGRFVRGFKHCTSAPLIYCHCTPSWWCGYYTLHLLEPSSRDDFSLRSRVAHGCESLNSPNPGAYLGLEYLCLALVLLVHL